MLAILRHREFRHLFAAQVVALLGTGLATVALALLAFELAGERAGQVLGTALAIKMWCTSCWRRSPARWCRRACASRY
jgi:hypothetical protein